MFLNVFDIFHFSHLFFFAKKDGMFVGSGGTKSR